LRSRQVLRLPVYTRSTQLLGAYPPSVIPHKAKFNLAAY
jgi:hypothetical protein